MSDNLPDVKLLKSIWNPSPGLMEIYDDAFDRRDHIQSLIDQYEEIMDEIDTIGREAKNKVYAKDVFGRGKSLITDVSTRTNFLDNFLSYGKTGSF